ncbi:putative sulfoacetate transporter SauU [Anatilimnocola aggregata]|uniref:Putative sulfoacetate transporter SauU n=1 Tax=Anatilimnocola aggregata TaxID=2528021 RepID=A0A517YKZ2_9BACT|nr:MFS transporter [Anatilimnocola aggregata]QDU30896.1 putative sulfoacetate transporter SauU [Anatilimnocola aggregata]
MDKRKDSTDLQVTPSTHILLLVNAYLGFISLGLPDAVTGIAWPEIRDDFRLSQGQLGWVSVALGCAYFLSSFFAGKLLNWLGVGLLLTTSSLLVALAMFGNAGSPAFSVILICVVIWGLGSGAIDAGLNHYAASHFSPMHLNWLHACYSLGATLGPIIMTLSIASSDSWRLGYAIVGAIVLGLTLLFGISIRAWNNSPQNASEQAAPSVSMAATLQLPRVWLHIAIFFLYTGLEFMVGAWSKTMLTESRGVDPTTAGFVVTAYYFAIGVGRVVLGTLTTWVGVDRLLRVATIAAVSGSLLFAIAPGLILSTSGLVLLGLGLAPIFPCLMSRTPARLGTNYAVHAIGFQVSAATFGGASITAFAGLLAERVNLQAIAYFSVLLALLIWLMHEVLLRVPPPAKLEPRDWRRQLPSA